VQQLEREHGEEMDISILMPYISGKVGRQAYETGDTSLGALAAGQAVAFADRIEPLATIVGRLEKEAERALERLGTITGSACCGRKETLRRKA
jgi:nitronate monooxygenase